MSQLSQAIKDERQAKRQQHRADHYTDADHALKGQSKQERRSARSKNFKSQGNQNAADFNFDQHGKGHVSGQEVRHLLNSGQSKEDIMSAAQASGGEIGQRAQKRFDKWGAAKEKAQTVKQNPIGNGTNNGSNNDVVGDNNAVGNGNIAAGGNEVNGYGNATGYNNQANTQKDIGNTSQTVTQDNDQTSTVNGDGNYVYQRQDNSVRNYGGDSRVFNYQGGSNSALDTPVSNATMSGFYDYDDSPAAQAKRLDQRVTTANDYAKDNMDTSWIAQGAIKQAGQNAYINPRSLDNRIQERENASFARSQVMGANIFGDMANYDFDWKQPTPAKPIDAPDFDKMYKTYTDF